MVVAAMLDSLKSLNIHFRAQHAAVKSKLEVLIEIQYSRCHHLKKQQILLVKNVRFEYSTLYEPQL